MEVTLTLEGIALKGFDTAVRGRRLTPVPGRTAVPAPRASP